MKKILILNILLLISSIMYGYTMYSTSPYMQNRNTYNQNKTYRIGYSTVGYGRTNYYSGTYNPGQASNGGQPRKVKGYNSNGDTINTDNDGHMGNPDNMWENGYSYYYNNGHWYRKDANGHWEVWDSMLDWGLIGWNWYEPGHNHWYDQHPSVPNNPTEYFKDNPQPIGEPIIPITILMLAYLSYRIIQKQRYCKHYFIKLFIRLPLYLRKSYHYL